MDLAGVAARAGDLDRAQELAQSITNPNRQARVLADLAGMAARAG